MTRRSLFRMLGLAAVILPLSSIKHSHHYVRGCSANFVRCWCGDRITLFEIVVKLRTFPEYIYG